MSAELLSFRKIAGNFAVSHVSESSTIVVVLEGERNGHLEKNAPEKGQWFALSMPSMIEAWPWLSKLFTRATLFMIRPQLNKKA